MDAIDPPVELDVSLDTGDTVLVPSCVPRRNDNAETDAAPSHGTLLGRYLVVGEAGAGGMGVVVRAYDPKLRREVALKRLRIAGAGVHAQQGAARLLREARAMARLSHPNVLAVYEVEDIDTLTYVVMEYVEGTTLRAWNAVPGRGWREVLAMFEQAARGLAAAHAVGLVHRDFKPNNVLVGSDGRARVMDFGLAKGAEDLDPSAGPADASASASDIADELLTADEELLGTPAYMAPEQHAGTLADARADQYSWCVALWEALAGKRPFSGVPDAIAMRKLDGAPPLPVGSKVPRWLARVIDRGLAVEPQHRFAGMDELLAEVDRGRAGSRARRIAAVVGIATLGGVGVVGLNELEQRERVRACAAEGASIDEVWNDKARGRLRDGVIGTGVSHAAVTAEKVMPWIDAQARAWNEARTQVCLDDGEQLLHDGRGWDRDLVARALWCLDERRLELDALVSELSRSDAKVVHKAVQAAAGLTQVAACRKPELLLRLPAPPTEHRDEVQAVRAELSRAGALERAGKYDAGLELAQGALVRAHELEWPPLVAAAHQRVGFLLDRQGDYAAAEAALEAAFFAASKAGATEVAAAASDKLVFTVGYRLARHADGLRWAEHAEVALAALGDAEGLRTAGHLDKLAIVHAAAGNYAEARALHERALALKIETLGEEHPDVASSLNNLAAVHQSTAAWADAKPLHERALAIREQTLGPDHPDVAMSLANLGVVADATAQYAEARVLHERALVIRERALGLDHPDVAGSLNNLANVREALGDHAQAVALFERALEIQERQLGPDHPDVATSLSNLGLVRTATGAYADAQALHERALAIREKALGPDHAEVASSLDNLGLALAARGAWSEAKRLHERALEIRERVLGPEHLGVATTLNNLGRAYVGLGSPSEAVPRFERVLAIRERALGAEHGDLVGSLESLAEVYRATGATNEAKVAAARAKSLRARVER